MMTESDVRMEIDRLDKLSLVHLKSQNVFGYDECRLQIRLLESELQGILAERERLLNIIFVWVDGLDKTAIFNQAQLRHRLDMLFEGGK